MRIHHAGDTVRYEGMMPKIKFFGKIDIEILPINGRDAKRYLKNCIGNNAFMDYIEAKYNGTLKCIIPKVMDKISIT